MFTSSTILVAAILQYRSGQQIMLILFFFIFFSLSGLSYAIPRIGTLPSAKILWLFFFGIAIILLVVASVLVHYADKEKVIMTG